MTSREKITRLYNAGRKNKEFLAEIYEADKDEFPDNSKSILVKINFIMVFYGWLVGKYGAKNWTNFI